MRERVESERVRERERERARVQKKGVKERLHSAWPVQSRTKKSTARNKENKGAKGGSGRRRGRRRVEKERRRKRACNVHASAD
jgi:hypothetical protein